MTMNCSYENFMICLYEKIIKKYMSCNFKKFIKIICIHLILNFFINIILYNFSVSAHEVELSTNITY